MRYVKSYQNETAEKAALDNKELGKPYVVLIEDGGYIDWNSKEIDPIYQYFTIESLESGNFYVRNNDIYYSVNDGEWNVGKGSITLNTGDKVRFKHISTDNGQVSYCFTGNTIQFIAYGNIESLEYGDDFIGQTKIKISSAVAAAGAFGYLFKSSTGLMNVENLKLPATGGTSFCYAGMFYGCNQITKAPDILIDNLKSSTNTNVFNMFLGCSKLNYVKCLATQNTSSSLSDWLSGVSATGTFVKAAGKSYKSGASGIPTGWTVIEE